MRWWDGLNDEINHFFWAEDYEEEEEGGGYFFAIPRFMKTGMLRLKGCYPYLSDSVLMFKANYKVWESYWLYKDFVSFNVKFCIEDNGHLENQVVVHFLVDELLICLSKHWFLLLSFLLLLVICKGIGSICDYNVLRQFNLNNSLNSLSLPWLWV